MKVLGVIPARLASTRLERKPLQLINGKPLVNWVVDAVAASQTLTRVIVATDSDEIREIASTHGAEVMMTDPELSSGSERVAEVAHLLGESWDAVVNIQGDMPFISANMIDEVVSFTLNAKVDFAMGTAATVISEEAMFSSKSNVKVVLGAQSRALYFSRSPIPCSRDGEMINYQGRSIFGFKHIGLYVFKQRGLSLYRRGAERSELEEIEKLEQLRALAMGESIGVHVIEGAVADGLVEVDTAADLEKANKIAAV